MHKLAQIIIQNIVIHWDIQIQIYLMGNALSIITNEYAE